MMSAPLLRVTFADFWLADQLNSLVPVFMDFQYFACFYASFFSSSSWHERKGTCLAGGACLLLSASRWHDSRSSAPLPLIFTLRFLFRYTITPLTMIWLRLPFHPPRLQRSVSLAATVLARRPSEARVVRETRA